MTTLLGIIIFHIIILIRTQSTKEKSVPYGSVILFTALLVAFVVFIMMTMEEPEQQG